jgi:hypothetical protein
MSAQVTARASPLWQVVVKLKFIVIIEVSEALAAPDFCVIPLNIEAKGKNR